ncbi:hypothetical protein F4811DRAFT_550577 [Daldinia bambusicola]|nr:hypothetical protein F4811DRAFT_550577 [Daldinia bambusicola]
MAERGNNVGTNIARMRLTYARLMMVANLRLWDGILPCSQRDYGLIHSRSVDFVGYDNTSYLMKIVHQLEPDGLTPVVHIKIRVPEECPGAASGTTGFLWSIPSKMKFIQGPVNAIIIHDCTASPEGTLQLVSHIARRKWDILLLKETEPYEYQWLVAAIRDSGSFADLRHDPTDPRRQRALESLDRGGRP